MIQAPSPIWIFPAQMILHECSGPSHELFQQFSKWFPCFQLCFHEFVLLQTFPPTTQMTFKTTNMMTPLSCNDSLLPSTPKCFLNCPLSCPSNLTSNHSPSPLLCILPSWTIPYSLEKLLTLFSPPTLAFPLVFYLNGSSCSAFNIQFRNTWLETSSRSII